MDFFDEITRGLATRKVSIEEYCESDQYCGKRLYPRQLVLLKLMFLEELTGPEEDILDHWIRGGRDGREIVISPKIRERVEYLRTAGYSHFRECVLVGGRRSSKGFITGLALAKKMYDTLQLQDPGLYYNIDPDKEIYFSCLASAQDQAKKYQYADFSSTVARCEAMQQNITKIQELEFSVATEADKQRMNRWKRQGGRVGRDISKLRGVALAANAATLRGSATIAICFDEMAHMQQEGESAATAASVYDAAIPALAQFGKDAMIFCNSSPYTKIGKFYERYEDGLKLTEDGKVVAPFMFTFQFPSWALFEGYQGHRSQYHKGVPLRKAITQSPDWDPMEKKGDDYYYSADDRDGIIIERDTERQDPESYKVERRGQFAEIIDAFLRPEMVDRAYQGVPMRDGSTVSLRTNWSYPSFKFQYKAHLDPSSTTAGFGFALGHVEELEDTQGQLREHVVFDIVKRWQPEQFPDRVIDWEVVLDEVVKYINIFQPYEVTFDQFQSGAPISFLNTYLRKNNMGNIRVYEKTATSQYNWNRAEVFRTALYQGLVHIPNDTSDAEWSNRELKHLQQVNTAGRFPRVDRQEIGPVTTKDMADCLMEVTEALIGNVIAKQARNSLGELSPAFGAEGGYQIGGRNDQAMSTFYNGVAKKPSLNTFREQKKNADPLGRPSQRVREQLDSLTASRSGSWNTRSRRGRPGRGY